jgi:hypothetical protein
MMFKKDLLEMVLSGRKTQTRRLHKNLLKEKQKYVVKRNWYKNTEYYIQIKKVYPQKLGDVSEEEAIKEGFSGLDKFREAWIRINGSWNPEMVVTVYEFELAEPPPKQSRLE